MMSNLESRILDINSDHWGESVEDLMYNAGGALYDVLSDRFPDKRILIVCGPGNNGGDGFACAVRYKGTADVALLVPDGIKTNAAKMHFDRLAAGPMMFSDVSLDNYDVVLDCVLGTGARSPLADVYKEYIKKIKKFKGTVVSADVPTGFGTEDALIPDITVTFHDRKEGMNEKNCGTIIVADIGIPEGAVRYIGPGDMLRYPIRKRDSHKGENGRLLIIGGGPYIGAPVMAAMAAQRVGIDLVHIATPIMSYTEIATMSPTFIMHKLSGDLLTEKDVKELLELAKKVDAVLIGPGLGTDEGTMKAVREFISECSVPVVADADGITAIASMKKIPGKVIITPHHREFNRFFGSDFDGRFGEGEGYLDDARESVLKNVSKERNVTVLLKGERDVIASAERIRYNYTGTSAMTVGGTGDVLAGAVAGLLSKNMDLFDAACLGAFICGLAGEDAFDEFYHGMIATDVIGKIPKVLKKYLEG